MTSSDSDADLFRYRQNDSDSVEKQLRRKRYRAKKARHYRASQQVQNKHTKSQRNAFTLSTESDLEYDLYPEGVPVTQDKSHILQELRNEVDESTADQFDDVHDAFHFTSDPDFSVDFFPVEADDPVEYYANKFPTVKLWIKFC